VLGTVRKDGRARLSPMLYVYADGMILISTTHSRGGGKTAKRDPRVTVCVINPENTQQYLTIYGRAEVIEDEAASIRLFGAFRGTVLEGEALAAARTRIAEEGRIVLRITPEEYFPR
jgi:PPOX class probable F420-dependent enzyme